MSPLRDLGQSRETWVDQGFSLSSVITGLRRFSTSCGAVVGLARGRQVEGWRSARGGADHSVTSDADTSASTAAHPPPQPHPGLPRASSELPHAQDGRWNAWSRLPASITSGAM
jgi:hypothetical protein